MTSVTLSYKYIIVKSQMHASVQAFNPRFGTYYLDKKIIYNGFGRSQGRNKGE